MKTYEIKDQEFDLKKAIVEGRISPTDVVDSVVWAHGRKIEIRMNDSLKDYGSLKEAFTFFWDYSGKKPFLVRETEIRDNCIILEQDKTLMLQMQILQLGTMRVGIAFQFDNTYFCGYVRNLEVKKEELQLIDRSICQLAVSDRLALVAYWTESGILSVMTRDGSKFDDEFYQVKLSEYYWEKDNLVAYLETPLMAGEATINMLSVSTNAHCTSTFIKLENVAVSGLKRVWKIEIDLSGMPADDSDGYVMHCTLDRHSFGIYFDGETDDDALCRITLKSGETLDACVIKDKNGQFVLKTGKIYPVMLSIVTAVYNTAPFLAEMINSVLSQNVSKLKTLCEDYRKDYYQNIYEFILVDDGSKDGSADILDDYAKISDKIKVIHKENGGVSSARNAGISAARGKYINFADSDDKLSENFVAEMLLYFEAHYDEIDILTAPIRFFDGRNEEHWSNYKFKKGDRILDLKKEPLNTLMFVNASLFKNEKVKGVRLFNEKLKTSEDVNFIYSFFIEDGAFLGLTNKCEYLYRRRTVGEESLIQSSKKDKNRYLEYFTIGMKYLTQADKTSHDNLPRYIQFLIACDLQWRFIEDKDASIAKSVLTDSEFELYKNYLVETLKKVDIDIIWTQKNIWREQKMFMSKWKMNRDPDKKYIEETENIHYYYDDFYLVDAGSNYVQINFIDIMNKKLYLEGTIHTFEKDSVPYICMNGSFIELPQSEKYDFNIYSVGEAAFYGKHFSYEFELDPTVEEYEFDLYEKIEDHMVKKRDIRYGNRAALNKNYSDSYILKDGWAIRKEGSFKVRQVYLNSDTLSSRYSLHSFLRYERDFENQIARTAANSNNKKKVIEKALQFRQQALQIMSHKNDYIRKRIWLISDRVNMADDNGEALFIYLNQLKPEGIETYFVINKDCDDFARLQKYGNVVAQGSEEHKLLFFMAEYNISSHFDEHVLDPFAHEGVEDIFKDLTIRPKFVFLQHGIIKDDISSWLNRLRINAYGFVLSTRREYQSLIEYNYMYSEKELWLTGLPRYDRLYHDENRYITIMPTWRAYLSTKDTNDKNRIVMKKGFKETDFCKFYSSLLNNADFLEAAKKYNYKIAFKPHPSVLKNIDDFDLNDSIEVWNSEMPYRKAFAESNLCITDYSSSVMDFVYLRKPVVYVQFDKERFFSGEHTYEKGYFEYERDGFGEVTYDLDSLIEIAIEYMKNECCLKDKYRKRIDDFFEFSDQNCCERVYKRLIASEEK